MLNNKNLYELTENELMQINGGGVLGKIWNNVKAFFRGFIRTSPRPQERC